MPVGPFYRIKEGKFIIFLFIACLGILSIPSKVPACDIFSSKPSFELELSPDLNNWLQANSDGGKLEGLLKGTDVHAFREALTSVKDPHSSLKFLLKPIDKVWVASRLGDLHEAPQSVPTPLALAWLIESLYGHLGKIYGHGSNAQYQIALKGILKTVYFVRVLHMRDVEVTSIDSKLFEWAKKLKPIRSDAQLFHRNILAFFGEKAFVDALAQKALAAPNHFMRVTQVSFAMRALHYLRTDEHRARVFELIDHTLSDQTHQEISQVAGKELKVSVEIATNLLSKKGSLDDSQIQERVLRLLRLPASDWRFFAGVVSIWNMSIKAKRKIPQSIKEQLDARKEDVEKVRFERVAILEHSDLPSFLRAKRTWTKKVFTDANLDHVTPAGSQVLEWVTRPE